METGSKRYPCGCVLHVELSDREEPLGKLKMDANPCYTYPGCIGYEAMAKIVEGLKKIPGVETYDHRAGKKD